MVKIPDHLKEHVAEQNYNLYTDIDQATWRYIMRVSKFFFKKHAHQKYVDGLNLTGITTDKIPRISEMDHKLKKFGWRAVTVTGFIPPSVFLEFQSLGILPIACDMRRLEHLEYTPSPDIVHEAAGHAPIIADASYAAYLRQFGEIARKVIFAKEDIVVYEAIKYLSDIKEAPKTTEEEIKTAYQKLDEAYKKIRYVSEAAQLSRLGWWTIEYGLVKKNKKFKIYGAGLLSSVGESYDAIMGRVKKIPLTIKCVEKDYDITKPQPQLYYVKNFTQLKKVISQLSSTMAYKKGGLAGLKRAKLAETLTTTELDSGLQISGVMKDIILKKKTPIYLQFSGPTQLAYQDIEIENHSSKYHAQGFGTPLGRLKTFKKSAEFLTAKDMVRLGFEKDKVGHLTFESGIIVEGQWVSSVRKKNRNVILSFKNCKVTYGSQILFDPSWGTFDMACGEVVTSVFGGAADRAAYLKSLNSAQASMKNQTSNLTLEHMALLPLYQTVRKLREDKSWGRLVNEQADYVLNELDQHFEKDWLLRLEVLELLMLNKKSKLNADDGQRTHQLISRVRSDLHTLSEKSKKHKSLILRGLQLFD